MNEQQSRVLDFWIGVPLCFLLTVLRRLCGLFSLRGAVSSPPRKILFIKLAEMGAIVLSMPAFEAARRRVGRENLYLLMLVGNRPVLDLIDVFPESNVLTIRDKNLWTFAHDVIALVRRCRREGIDTVIDLEGFARISAILTFLSGARTRVGHHRFTVEGLYRGDLMTHRLAVNYYNHASVQFLTMVEALDAPPSELPLVKRHIELGSYELPRFEPLTDEINDIRRLVVQRCGREPSRPLVILNCNLIDLLPLRRWPRDAFAALGRRILKQNAAATLLLTGLPAERTLAEALARDIDAVRTFVLAGDTTLRSLVVLFTQADLLITSDCGPGHMASLAGIPTVSIFGPETPRLYAPLGAQNHALWAGLACSPCLNAFNQRRSCCTNNVCMQSITVDQVFDAALAACPALRPASAKPGA